MPDKDQHGRFRYVSADCEAEIIKTAVDTRIAWQTRGDLQVKERRAEARFLRLLTGDLRNLPEKDEDGRGPIVVERDPTAADPDKGMPANSAHCAIKNISNKSRTDNVAENRKYVDYLRKELLKIIKENMSYQELFKREC